MTITAPVVRNHIEYTAWATRRLSEAAAGLSAEERARDFGTADRSVIGTMLHVFRSERIWLDRIQQRSSTLEHLSGADVELNRLQQDWALLHDDWRVWAADLDDGSADGLISYTDLKGHAWKQPLWEIMLHVVNHATHHRGQVSGFLRALGKTPPTLDFIAFARLQK